MLSRSKKNDKENYSSTISFFIKKIRYWIVLLVHGKVGEKNRTLSA